MKPNNTDTGENESVAGSSQPVNVRSRFRLFLKWFTCKENIAVCAIAAIIFILHLLTISKPAAMMWDETYYVPEANSFLHGAGLTVPEHPPLGKWLIAAGISIFGNNPFGWRIFAVIFGTASIIIFYLICVQLARKETPEDGTAPDTFESGRQRTWFTVTTFVPVLAAFLFAFENFSFVQSGIAMLDVFSVTFMLLGFLLYLRDRYLLCGVVMGLAMLCKATAVLAILAIILHWALTHRHEISADISRITNKLKAQNGIRQGHAIWDMVKLMLSATVVWLVLLPLLEYPATHQLANPFSRTMYMLHFHLDYNTITGGNPNATTPWQWIIHPTNIVYWPKSFVFVAGRFVLPIDAANPLYYASVSWNIWVLLIPAILFTAYEVIRYRKPQHPTASFILCWFWGIYGMLILLELATKRVMFNYYFYPAIAAVCLAIAWSAWKMWLVMSKEKKRRAIFLSLLAVYTISTVVIFFFMSPFGGHFLFPR